MSAIMKVDVNQQTVNENIELIKRLREKRRKAQDEFKQALEDGLFMRLQHEMQLNHEEAKKEIFYMIRIEYPKRFYRYNRIANTSYHFHQYTFGDIVYDKKFDGCALVVYETAHYVIMWYYTEGEDTVRKRLKKDRKLVTKFLMTDYNEKDKE